MLLNGGSEWPFSLYTVSVSKEGGCSWLSGYTDPGAIHVFIVTLVTAGGGKMEINLTRFILNLNCQI